MSLVQVAPLLALPANGLLWDAACGVHEPFSDYDAYADFVDLLQRIERERLLDLHIQP